ncbi:KAP family P-loop NTPase fold protein [Tenacibaculum piscium]|uniref:KAP family P-loop NTPase fold protein n=1 Tax=Tenacibaculum piscium TaxID=1458515 RepID=UPI001F1ECD3B|nr:P-loop NTPase fold protein [Tenacibaculum piscium]
MSLSDLPIGKNGVDLFNFEHYAKKVQKIIQNNSNNSEPLTIGIYGKWGEGKTSFLNLIDKGIDSGEKEEGQKGILKYHFNPWRYSTEEEMLFDFFDGLSKMMFVNKDTTLQKVGKQLLKYSRYTKAVKLSASVGFSSNKAGATFDVSEIMKALGEDFIGKEVTLESLIQNINDKLKASKYKIVVFIDDIDRLDKDEIYTILKLIKLNANFNNFVYIVALDENHVAKAIGQRYGVDTKDGELFLEKIINIPIHLPKIESADFKQFFEIKLKEVFDNLGFSDENDNEKEAFSEIIREFRVQYFKNGREIIRVLNSFFVGAFAIGEEVNLRDLFWIEYLKVTDNIAFNVIKKYDSPNIEEELITNSTIIKYSTDILNKDEIFKEYSKEILVILFSESKGFMTRVKSNNGKNAIEISKFNLKINHPNHFDKYFSYHTIGKVSEINKKLIIQNIIDENKDELKMNFIDLRNKDNLKIHRFYSVIEDLINDENINYLFFYDFLFSNLDLLSESEKDSFGATYQSKMIKLVAFNLEKNNSTNDDIIQLAKKLSINQSCYFTKAIYINIEVKNKLEELIVKRVKQEYIGKPKPFFYDFIGKDFHGYTIMSYWNKNEEDLFIEYIDNNIKCFDNVLKLIRNFPNCGNDSYGELKKENFVSVKDLIDVDMIYARIKEYEPELINKIDVNYKVPYSLKHSFSELENVEQFIYHYKKDKNLIN